MRRVCRKKSVDVHMVEYECGPRYGADREALCREIRRRMLIKLNRSDHPEVSIAVPAHNEARSLLSCLSALSCLMTRRALDIMVIDNASTDNTAELAEACGVRVIKEPQKGIQFARQRGLIEARAPILCWTEADTLVPPPWIEVMARHFRDPKVVGVIGDYELVDLKPSIYRYRILVETLKNLLHVRDDMRFCTGANFAYRTAVAKEIGYNPNVGYGEDTAMAMALEEKGKVVRDLSPDIRAYTSGRRLNETGVKALFLGMLRYRYRRHLLGLSTDEIRQRELARNQERVFADYR